MRVLASTSEESAKGRQDVVHRVSALHLRLADATRMDCGMISGSGSKTFCRWAGCGRWEQLFPHLATDADNEYAMIDSLIVYAHQPSAGAPKKR